MAAASSRAPAHSARKAGAPLPLSPCRARCRGRAVRALQLAVLDLQRLFGEPLAVLPDPVRVDCGDLAGRGRRHVREHGERNIEMVVRVRSPGQPPVAAELRHAHRALHRPEMRIGERDVDGMHWIAWRQLPPVGGDHVGRRRNAGGAAEFGHDFAAGDSRFRRRRGLRHRPAHLLIAAQRDGFLERPRAVRIERDARFRESAAASAAQASISCSPGSTPPFSLKSLNP